ncbi:MAG: glycosyltransferase family 4 protein [Chloroflexi bacterium]|nr:glycosyltransferase family 4 protein [Chloroflexota bacterium]
MRILIISNYFPPFEIGGWEQLTADVAGLLKQRGHQVWVLTSNHRAAELTAPEPGVERALHLESPDQFYYHAPYTLTYRWREQQNSRMLARRVASFVPDIIFINGMWNLPLSLAWRAEQLCPGRVVYYLASPWPAEPAVHAIYWSDPAARLWLRRPKQLVGAVARRWLLPAAPRHQPAFEHVLCVSAYMQQFMVEQAGVPLSHTQVIHNGVDPAVFVPRSPNGHGPVLRLLYAGQLRADKGVHTAVEAVGQAVRADPSLRLALTIAGGGAPAYVELLQARIQVLGLAGIVTLPGQAPREQMPAILASHDVLLFPSVWPEPLARIVQEAMACGLVVIGTTTGGTPELLQDGENGLTFEAENATMLAGQITRLARDPALRSRLARAARETVEACFTEQRMVDEIEGYFREVVSGKNA